MTLRFQFTILDGLISMACIGCLIAGLQALFWHLPPLWHGSMFTTQYSPNGKLLAAGTESGRILLWDVDARRFRTLTGHTDIVQTVEFFPDGRRLLSASRDLTARVWDLESGNSSVLPIQLVGMRMVALSPDGNTIAVQQDVTGAVILWDLATNTSKTTQGGQWNVIAFADSGTLITSDGRGVITAWDVATLQAKWQISRRDRATCIARSPDGSRFAVGWRSSGVTVHDAQTGNEMAHFQYGSERIAGLAFSPDGKILATGGATADVDPRYSGFSRVPGASVLGLPEIDFTGVRLWDVLSGELKASVDRDETCWSVVFSPDGESLAVGRESWTTEVLDATTLDLRTSHVAFRPPAIAVWFIAAGALGAWIIVRRCRCRRPPGAA